MILLLSHSASNGGSPVRTTGRSDAYEASSYWPPDDFPYLWASRTNKRQPNQNQWPASVGGSWPLHIETKGGTFLLRSNWQYHRGDIYWADLNPVTGSEQGGIRPVVVLQNNCGNNYSPTLIVAAVTSKDKKKPCLPTHFLIKSNPAFTRPSVVLLEQIRTIDKSRLIRYSGSISPCDMLGIEWALILSLALEHFIRRFIPRHLLPLQSG